MSNELINPRNDKNLAKRATLKVIEASVSSTPGLAQAWALAEALLGNAAELRQKKIMEWLEMIHDNPAIFAKEMLETEEFQDAFVTSLEDYIKERNTDKRILLRTIFKDYASVKDPSVYPLERLYEITKQLTIFDAKNFSYLHMLQSERGRGLSFKDTRHSIQYIESVLHLISLGLLLRDESRNPTIKETPMITTPYIYVSELGEKYFSFIQEASSKESKELKHG